MNRIFHLIPFSFRRASALGLFLWLSAQWPALAQNPAAAATAPVAPKMTQQELIMLTLIGVTILVAILVLITVMYTLVIVRQVVFKEVAKQEKVESLWSSIDKNVLTKAVAIEEEESILLDHNYDGIRELDNHLPPWWVYLFYGTVAFAIIYMLNYHVLEISPLSIKEYDNAMAQAAVEVAEYKKLHAKNIDETNVAFVKEDKAALENGKALFDKNCVACHGQNLEGGTGPNLTDDAWIHGGGIQAVFKTIKYGVPKKGMISWEKKLKPDEMQNIASYILTKQGTNPANAKEAQGDTYKLKEDGSAEKVK
ncbi:MAG: cbb3-type cytochrome c oxidase N-terminal domain-containing protein [Microscillaceae bacterium]